MSNLKTKRVQIGDHSTATNNFVMHQSDTPDGKVHISNGTLDSHTSKVTLAHDGKLGIGTTSPGALLSIPAGGSSTPRFAIESATDNNDFTITQYEDGNGTYTMLGQNVKLNSGGNNTVSDAAHKTAGIQFDARNHGALTFVTGAANTATENMQISSAGHVTTPNQPYFMVYRNGGNYNVGAGQTVSIIYDTARYNTGGHFNNSNYRFTAPIDGLYNFSGSVNHYNLPAGTRLRIQLHLNGQLTLMGGYIRTYDAGDHNVVFNSSLKLSANDYVEMKRYSDGASAAGTSSGQLWNWFSGYLIG